MSTPPGDQTDQGQGQDKDQADTRITAGKLEEIKEFMASQKVREAQTKAKAQVDKASTDQDSLKAELEAALKELQALKDNRRKELLLMLDTKDQKEYKDEPIEALELLTKHLKTNPKVRGIDRPADDAKEDKRSKHEKNPGYIGGRDPRTGKRY